MTNPQVAILMLSLFIVLVLLGFPIAITLIAMGVGFGFYAYYQAGSVEPIADALNNQVFYLLNQTVYSVMENDTLVAIPLFLFMGYVVERANIVNRLFYSLQMAARNLPGSMAVAALVTCAVFSTASGIVGAVVTLMGLLAFPAMAAANYNKNFASGVICAGGTLGILIPPSIMLIVYAAIAELSPLRLYAAAMFPGLLLAGFYILYVLIHAGLKPSIAPTPKAEDVPPITDHLFWFADLIRTPRYSHHAGARLHSRRARYTRGGGCDGRIGWVGARPCLSLAQLAQSERVGLPDGEDHGDGVLDVYWLVDFCRGVFLSRRTRCDRTLGCVDGSRDLAVSGHGSTDHFYIGMAARVVRNTDNFCADFFTHVADLRGQSLFLCHVGRTESADLFSNSADGHVGRIT